MQDLIGKGKEGNCLDREGFHEVSAHTALQIAIKLDIETLRSEFKQVHFFLGKSAKITVLSLNQLELQVRQLCK